MNICSYQRKIYTKEGKDLLNSNKNSSSGSTLKKTEKIII